MREAATNLMPVFVCKFPTCSTFVRDRGACCAAHAAHAGQERAARAKFYDQHVRNPDARAFYASQAWKLARAAKLAECPFCERCKHEWARHVHHAVPLAQCTVAQRTAQTNLMSLCVPCHNAVEAEAAA